MSIQECALYGELVLYLRDRAAELAAELGGDLEETQQRLDAIIRDWFFTPRDDLHGCAPRELIWAEQRGEPNPVDPEQLDGFFVEDCALCQATSEEIETALDSGENAGYQWYYDDGGYPLIARYDPEGWEEGWAEDETSLVDWLGDSECSDSATGRSPAGDYAPLPTEPEGATPEEFAARLRRPWLDPMLHRAAQTLTDRLDCPEPMMFGFRYRPVTYEEALSLLVGLYDQGVNVEVLLAQIEAFPYRNIALDWMSQPTENASLVVEAMENEIAPDDDAEMARFRHHRDFMFMLSRVIPSGARLWLQGWLDAVGHGALVGAVRDDEQQTGHVF